jgi:hypothetical protein
MYLLYLDDSGSVANQNENYFVLGGVAIFERQIHWLAQEMETLAASIEKQRPAGVEFHASEIFSGRAAPWNGMKKEDRRAVIRDVLAIMARSHESTRAFACAVHKASFQCQDPVELAFEDLCSRFDMLLKRIYHRDRTPERGLLVLDKSTYETGLQKLARDFRTLGTRWNLLVNLVEVPLFVDSSASRAVQLADHIAYAVFRRYESGDTSYFDIIQSKFDSEEGRLHGLVHKTLSDPGCMCPACLSRRLTRTQESQIP